MNNIIFYFVILILIYSICKSTIEQFKSIKYIDILEIGEPINTQYINEFKNINRLIVSQNDTKLPTNTSKKMIVQKVNDINNLSYKNLILKYKLNNIHQVYIYDESKCSHIMTNILNDCLKKKSYFPQKLYLNTRNQDLLTKLELNGYFIQQLKTNIKYFTILTKFNFTHKNKVSIIILNYNRPHNLSKSIPILDKIPIIDEIIVANGHSNHISSHYSDKIVNLDDSSNNKKYFTLRRFFLSKYVKNDIIIMLDDDVIPSKKLIYSMIAHYNKDKRNIYGAVKRCCYSDGYYCNKSDCLQPINNCELFDNYNVILTGLTLIPTKIMARVSKQMIKEPLFKTVIKNKGNGEDLLFNYVFRKIYNKKPIHVNGTFKNLDDSNGFSTATSTGMNLRSSLCKKFNFEQFD